MTEKAADNFQSISKHLKMIQVSSWPGFVPAIHDFLA